MAVSGKTSSSSPSLLSLFLPFPTKAHLHQKQISDGSYVSVVKMAILILVFYFTIFVLDGVVCRTSQCKFCSTLRPLFLPGVFHYLGDITIRERRADVVVVVVAAPGIV